MNSAEVVERLRAKFPLKEGWISMSEVTPPGTRRRFDFVAIMGWGSRGHECHGFEIKVDRSDWLRELNDAAKAQPLASLCTRWWIVAPPGVVKVEELPPAWGLLVIHTEQIRTGKQAPCLTPEPWSPEVWRCFLFRLVVRESSSESEIETAHDEGYKKGHADGRKQSERSFEHDRKRFEQLQETVNEAEKATGVSLSKWTEFPRLGAAMRLLRDNTIEDKASEMRRDADRLAAAAERMRDTANDLYPQPVEGVAS